MNCLVRQQKQKQIKKIVKNAFIASNMDIDEYINMIEEECHMCRCEINYVQKEKMKEYLLQTFQRKLCTKNIDKIVHSLDENKLIN